MDFKFDVLFGLFLVLKLIVGKGVILLIWVIECLVFKFFMSCCFCFEFNIDWMVECFNKFIFIFFGGSVVNFLIVVGFEMLF